MIDTVNFFYRRRFGRGPSVSYLDLALKGRMANPIFFGLACMPSAADFSVVKSLEASSSDWQAMTIP